MSAATADRLLCSQRKRGQRGLSTTRSGTLLRQQIPIRTFQEWEETRPGFLEAERARPLWRRHRGRLPVYPDAHRRSNWLDVMTLLANAILFYRLPVECLTPPVVPAPDAASSESGARPT
jgi:hypothetical protein